MSVPERWDYSQIGTEIRALDDMNAQREAVFDLRRNEILLSPYVGTVAMCLVTMEIEPGDDREEVGGDVKTKWFGCKPRRSCAYRDSVEARSSAETVMYGQLVHGTIARGAAFCGPNIGRVFILTDGAVIELGADSSGQLALRLRPCPTSRSQNHI